MDKDLRFVVTSCPHAATGRTVRGVMLDVVIALMFPAVASVIIFGYRAAVLISVSIISSVLFEWLYCKIVKIPVSVGDLSAVVTGMLLAFNVPAGLPVWMMVVGALVSIVVVKMLFGGIGCNFVNPALAGRAVLMLSFGSAMTNYAFPGGESDVMSAATGVLTGPDILASSTPLTAIQNGNKDALDLWTLFIGNYGGVLGETCALAILLGFAYMLIRKVINPVIPLAYIGSMFLVTWALGNPAPLLSILSGGLLLGAVYMATDYTTSPYSNWGRVVFGVGCGVLTALIRTFSSTTEGVTFAILIMNLLVPYINDLTRRRPFGRGGAKVNG